MFNLSHSLLLLLSRNSKDCGFVDVLRDGIDG
jgi:hypothetical protein